MVVYLPQPGSYHNLQNINSTIITNQSPQAATTKSTKGSQGYPVRPTGTTASSLMIVYSVSYETFLNFRNIFIFRQVYIQFLQISQTINAQSIRLPVFVCVILSFCLYGLSAEIRSVYIIQCPTPVSCHSIGYQEKLCFLGGLLSFIKK